MHPARRQTPVADCSLPRAAAAVRYYYTSSASVVSTGSDPTCIWCLDIRREHGGYLACSGAIKGRGPIEELHRYPQFENVSMLSSTIFTASEPTKRPRASRRSKRIEETCQPLARALRPGRDLLKLAYGSGSGKFVIALQAWQSAHQHLRCGASDSRVSLVFC